MTRLDQDIAVMVRTRVFFFAATVLLLTPSASAQVQLDERQNDNWYASQAAVFSLLTVGSIAALTAGESVAAPRLRRASHFEEGTKDNDSALTSRVSDITLLTSVAAPLGSLYLGREGSSYGNSLLLQGQAFSASLLANTITKKLVLRTRPFTHRADYISGQADDNYSFYSGHSALAFTSATSSSVLFSAVQGDSQRSSIHWGASFALASFTAHARVRAGKHYPTDVLVGSAIGVGFGLLTPALHQVDLSPSPRDLAAAATGLASGSLLAFLLPRRRNKNHINATATLVPTPAGLMLLSSGQF